MIRWENDRDSVLWPSPRGVSAGDVHRAAESLLHATANSNPACTTASSVRPCWKPSIRSRRGADDAPPENPRTTDGFDGIPD
jgi:hypothetical protein